MVHGAGGGRGGEAAAPAEVVAVRREQGDVRRLLAGPYGCYMKNMWIHFSHRHMSLSLDNTTVTDIR